MLAQLECPRGLHRQRLVVVLLSLVLYRPRLARRLAPVLLAAMLLAPVLLLSSAATARIPAPTPGIYSDPVDLGVWPTLATCGLIAGVCALDSFAFITQPRRVELVSAMGFRREIVLRAFFDSNDQQLSHPPGKATPASSSASAATSGR